MNLLVNARQATSSGGMVRVRLDYDAQSNEVILQVRDTGSGIAPELLPKIFDPFFTTKMVPMLRAKVAPVLAWPVASRSLMHTAVAFAWIAVLAKAPPSRFVCPLCRKARLRKT